jgi:hypothetical protein
MLVLCEQADNKADGEAVAAYIAIIASRCNANNKYVIFLRVPLMSSSFPIIDIHARLNYNFFSFVLLGGLRLQKLNPSSKRREVHAAIN